MTDCIIVCGLVLFSLAYCISCTRWADRIGRKAGAVQRWAEDQRAAEGVGPYREEVGEHGNRDRTDAARPGSD